MEQILATVREKIIVEDITEFTRTWSSLVCYWNYRHHNMPQRFNILQYNYTLFIKNN